MEMQQVLIKPDGENGGRRGWKTRGDNECRVTSSIGEEKGKQILFSFFLWEGSTSKTCTDGNWAYIPEVIIRLWNSFYCLHVLCIPKGIGLFLSRAVLASMTLLLITGCSHRKPPLAQFHYLTFVLVFTTGHHLMRWLMASIIDRWSTQPWFRGE